MNTLKSVLSDLFNALSDKHLLLCIDIISYFIILSIGFLLVSNYIKHKNISQNHAHSVYLLLGIICSIAIENLGWILKLSHDFGYISIKYTTVQYFILAEWIADLILYYAFGLFIENLIYSSFKFSFHQRILMGIHVIFGSMLTYSGFLYIWDKPSLISVHTMLQIVPFYRIAIILPSLVIAFRTIYQNNIPAILKRQLTDFLRYIILPIIISDFIQCMPFYSQGATAEVTGIIALIGAVLINIGIVYCARTLIHFRLFNFAKKVQSYDAWQLSFTGYLKDAVEYLSLATTPQEVVYITQTFFKENFNISSENICLNFRYKQEICAPGIDNYCSITSNIIESFLNKDHKIISLLREYKILVADEIMFDAYYNNTPHEITLSEFMNSINSDIFLPMYDKNSIIAYLTIKRAEHHKFYDLADQNKIVIFGTYLASVINIMHNGNTATLLHENKKLKDELYLKHQEVNQYKESMKNLLKQKNNGQIGIVFYKDNRLAFGNEAAQQLLEVNISQQKKHPLTLALTKLAEQVESFRSSQSKFIYDMNNKQLLVTGVPHFDYQSGVILIITYADSAEIIKNHIDKLQNPSQIDYLLYLETTKSGKLINQILPSKSETLLNFKIKLLEIALQKKAILLQSQHDDLSNIVEIIHHISLRSTLHIIELKHQNTTHDLEIKLFGLNPVLANEQECGLLKRLDQQGTLFIKNIEFLDLQTQAKLAHFIRYGIFTLTKSEQKVLSDVRIICSTNENPQLLVEQNRLSPMLYNELIESSLTLPSCLTLEQQELQELIDDFAQHAIETNQLSHLLQISKQEKHDIIAQRPTSLHEFKCKIEDLLTQKAKDYQIFHESPISSNVHTDDPKIMKAAALGKQALKDKQLMTFLWQEFGCQNKIAQLLGVNRSSVQRRCKEYNLM